MWISFTRSSFRHASLCAMPTEARARLVRLSSRGVRFVFRNEENQRVREYDDTGEKIKARVKPESIGDHAEQKRRDACAERRDTELHADSGAREILRRRFDGPCLQHRAHRVQKESDERDKDDEKRALTCGD